MGRLPGDFMGRLAEFSLDFMGATGGIFLGLFFFFGFAVLFDMGF